MGLDQPGQIGLVLRHDDDDFSAAPAALTTPAGPPRSSAIAVATRTPRRAGHATAAHRATRPLCSAAATRLDDQPTDLQRALRISEHVKRRILAGGDLSDDQPLVEG